MHHPILYVCVTCARVLCVCMYRTDVEGSLGPIEIQSTIIFDLVVLSQLANTSKAVIEVLLLLAR